MTIRKIIAPTDLSQHSEAGVGYAMGLARDRNAEAEKLDFAAVLEGIAERRLRDLSRFIDANFPHTGGVAIEPAVSFGNVANEIVSAVQAQRADLIVMAKRKRGALQRLVGKSISEAVSRQTDCPVLTFYPESEIRSLWSGRIGLAEQALQGFAA